MHIPEEEIHYHTHADGTVHAHFHGHTHTHTQTKAVINRLSRAIGHLESVKRMVESGRDCSEVLVQLAAVRSALNNTAKVILKDISSTASRTLPVTIAMRSLQHSTTR